MEERLDIVRFIKDQVAFERLIKVKVSALERYFLRNDKMLVISKQKAKAEEHFKFD